VKVKKIISLVRNSLFQILFLSLVPKILKNCLKIVKKKVWQKVAIGKFVTFLTPLQASSTKICLQVESSNYLVMQRVMDLVLDNLFQIFGDYFLKTLSLRIQQTKKFSRKSVSAKILTLIFTKSL